MEAQMLKIILFVLTIVGLVVRRVFSKRDTNKTAEETLKAPSPTEEAVSAAEAAADAKFKDHNH
jgi:Na+-transporting methylmalonyl-CoA/oxaloacetate decarboxylase gamma subunit